MVSVLQFDSFLMAHIINYQLLYVASINDHLVTWSARSLKFSNNNKLGNRSAGKQLIVLIQVTLSGVSLTFSKLKPACGTDPDP